MNHPPARRFAALLMAALAAAALLSLLLGLTVDDWRNNITLIDQDESRHAVSDRAARSIGIALLALGAALGASALAVVHFRNAMQAFWRCLAADTGVLWGAIRGGVHDLRRPENRWALAALLLAVAGGASIRVAFLTTPMEYDESYTYLYFSSRDLVNLASNYTVPNNHIFHSILVKTSSAVFGSSPLALRLPALLAGVALIPLVFVLGARLVGYGAGGAAALLAAAAYPLVSYSANSRGYTWLLLWFLLSWLAATLLLERANTVAWAALVLSSALGFFTMPVMLYPAGIVFAWTLWETPSQRRRRQFRLLLAAGAFIAALTAALYSPALLRSGPHAILSNEVVSPLPWALFLARIVPRLHEAMLDSLTFVPGVFRWLMAAAVVAALALPGSRNRQARRVVAAALVWTAVVTVARQTVPFTRVLIFLVPIACLVAGTGLLEIGRRFRREQAGLALAALLSTTVMLRAGVALTQERTGMAGAYDDLPAVVADLGPRLGSPDILLAAAPLSEALRYHAVRAGLPRGMVLEQTLKTNPAALAGLNRVCVVEPSQPNELRDGMVSLRAAGLLENWGPARPTGLYAHLQVRCLDRLP